MLEQPVLDADLELLLIQGAKQRHLGTGEVLLDAGEEPNCIWWVQRGSLRSLMQLPPRQEWRTVERHGAGTLVGWLGVAHGRAIEHLRAAEPTDLFELSADRFHQLWSCSAALRNWCAAQTPRTELVHLLLHLAHANPSRSRQLDHWSSLIDSCRWSIDSAPDPRPGGQWHWPDGRCWPEQPPTPPLQQRLLWLPDPAEQRLKLELEQLTPAPKEGLKPENTAVLRLNRASGPEAIPLALCDAVASYLQVPLDHDDLRDQISSFLQQQQRLNLVNMGQLLSSLDLSVTLSDIPIAQLERVPTPAVIEHEGCLALVDGVDPDGQLRLLDPELGPLRVPASAIAEGDATLRLLLLRRRPGGKQQRFSWGWYAPYLRPHRRELIEVLASSAAVNVLALVTPLGVMRLINAQTSGSDSLDAVISIGVILVLAGVVQALITAVRSLIFTGIANRVDMDTRETILDRLVRLPQGFFDARPVGQITYYFTQLDRLRDFLISKALTTLVDFSFSLLYLAVLLSLNPLLTLITLSSLPLFIVLALIANPVVEHQIDRVVHEGVNTNSYLTEAITGIQTIKSQNAELKTRWAFQDRYSRFIGEDFKLKVSGETVGALAKCIGDLSGIATMVVGIWLVSRNELSIGALFAFRIIGDRVTGPLVQLVQTWQQFKIQSRNLKLAADVVDRPTEQSESGARNIPMPPLQGAVTIRNVDFRYTDDGPAILHNVSLDVPQGTFVGMVGGSGSGKSTLLKLLPRFYSPESGQIQIDGLDVSKVELYSLRRQIGVVPQDSLLFDGTIKENLLMVKPDATSEELMRAARIACAHDFIMELPEGYNSSVGERGAGLSGGQRQRMALARAVLQNPSMLILDEATSALDARTERQVCRNLFEAFRGRTVFFITHRLSTVRPADMIVVMDQGAVMEIGDHASLLERQGWYYALYQSQAQEGLS